MFYFWPCALGNFIVTLLCSATFRQTHRKTVDGRLCAAAFVQNRETYTGCADAANPAGESGRPWCYVETQVLDGHVSLTNHRNCIVDIFDCSCWVPMAVRQLGIIVVRVPSFVIECD